MSSSGRNTPSSSHIRKRRAHKRSRNGCVTCKQRHIRCDELKPVCTNCLTRGGDCGYPDAGSKPGTGPGSGSGGAGIADFRTLSRAEQLRILLFPSSPVDPFDALPIKMPHRSMELFNHFVAYRIFSRTPVPKSQNSACLGMVFGGPGIFRAGILLTALHYSWVSPSGSLAHTDMEETYLYHKLEAMRHVNELVADAQMCTTDDCIGLIAALAMAESGMGDVAAAEAHLKGLSTLVNMRRPEEWQHRFWGILQRIILVTGSFIAAAKSPERGHAIDDDSFDTPFSPQKPHHSNLTGPVFSATPFLATRLSPFYMGSTPDLEACKEDAEAEVLMNALRRLSFLAAGGRHGAEEASSFLRESSDTADPTMARIPTTTIPPSTAGSGAGFVAGSSSLSADEADTTPGGDYLATLFADTDAYSISMLFRPRPICTEADDTAQADGWGHRGTTSGSSLDLNIDPALTRSSNMRQTYPYASLPPEQFPSSSRAWASASYLYLHVILEPLIKWVGPDQAGSISSAATETDAGRKTRSQPPKRIKAKAIDNPYLLRLLLDTLKTDVQHTEQAMRTGKYSRELWIWMVMVGAYTTAVIDESDVWLGGDLADGRKFKAGICPEGARFTERMEIRLGAGGGPSSQARTHMMDTTHSPGSRSWIGPPAAGDAPFFDQTTRDLTYFSNLDSYFPPFPSSSSVCSSSESESDRESPHRSSRSPHERYSRERNKSHKRTSGKEEEEEEEYISSLKRFFSSCMRSWSETARVTSWQGARQNMAKIAWPGGEHMHVHGHIASVERMVANLWESAVSASAAGGDQTA